MTEEEIKDAIRDERTKSMAAWLNAGIMRLGLPENAVSVTLSMTYDDGDTFEVRIGLAGEKQ